VTFGGFDPAAVALLDRLPDMTADEYADHKAMLTAGVTKPGAGLIADLADLLDADLTVAPRSSVSPLHRDLRFAPEGAARYKDHLLLTSWEGRDKRVSPMFWIRVDAHRVGFASGIGFTPEVRERWRKRVAGEPGATVANELAALIATRGAEVAGDRIKRVPAPFDADHPRADLLLHTGFQVRFAEPLPASIDRPEFVAWCAERLAALLPVHHWLLANLTDRTD
jgi:uncharacterized protein (DUF2461 family)